MEQEINIDISALTELGQRLIDAILNRATLEEIQALVDDGAPLWFQDEDEGISPLHAAAYTEREDVAKLLIDAGAPWNAGVFIRTLLFPGHRVNALSGQFSDHSRRYRAVAKQWHNLCVYSRCWYSGRYTLLPSSFYWCIC